jgi:hypothetical protein
MQIVKCFTASRSLRHLICVYVSSSSSLVIAGAGRVFVFVSSVTERRIFLFLENIWRGVSLIVDENGGGSCLDHGTWERGITFS